MALATVVWDPGELARFFRDPEGDLGRTTMRQIGEIVTAGAKARARVRTGAMRAAITYDVGTSVDGLYVDVVSPVRNPHDLFPYAIEHERRHPRDRRPHRSLVPALRDLPKLLPPVP